MLFMRLLEILRVQSDDRDCKDELQEAKDPVDDQEWEWVAGGG